MTTDPTPTTAQLLKAWMDAKKAYEELSDQYIKVRDVEPGKPLERGKPLDVEAIETIGKLQEALDEAEAKYVASIRDGPEVRATTAPVTASLNTQVGSADVPTVAALSVPETSRVVALRLVEVIDHTDAIKDWIRQYFTKETATDFEKAILTALRVQITEIDQLIEQVLGQDAPVVSAKQKSSIRRALPIITWLIGALRGVDDVDTLVQHLEKLVKLAQGLLGL